MEVEEVASWWGRRTHSEASVDLVDLAVEGDKDTELGALPVDQGHPGRLETFHVAFPQNT